VVLRPPDSRKNVIRVLKKVALFAALNFTQMQRLTDLLNEAFYNPGDYIITQGEEGDSFYIIEHGQCDCTINIPASDINPVATTKVVLSLNDHDYFGERALLEAKPRAANVIARVPTKVLYITKRSFEEVLGPLASIIDEDRKQRETLAAIALNKEIPSTFQDVRLAAVVSNDSVSPVLLGSFNTQLLNITVRSFILSVAVQAEAIASLSRCIDASKIITANYMVNHSEKALVPRNVGLFRDSNAIHLLFRTAVVTDLGSLLRTYADKFTNNTEMITYIMACIVSALETVHGLGIIYRAVHPESLHVDALGRIILMDFRVSKLGARSESFRTFTVCGVSDYLAPEQISQTGHGFAVDLWSLGVLLCELATGQHPFASSSEVATYSKVSSFGSPSFPSLTFPDNISLDIRGMVNALLAPLPGNRLGANGLSSVKSHALFSKLDPVPNWDRIALGNVPSPLASIAAVEMEEISKENIDKALHDSFVATFDKTPYPSLTEVLDGIHM
jgi:cGMP-dependent protein kinase